MSTIAIKELYAQAAQSPIKSLCCAPGARLHFRGVTIPEQMKDTTYGCGTTVHLDDLTPDMTILYLGVGGGLEALGFSHVTRRTASVIAVDPVPEMLERARCNLEIAQTLNPWFKTEFVKLVPGDALDLPISEHSVDVVAQNCVFNMFRGASLSRALAEAYRVLRFGGLLCMSDPVATVPIPERLAEDERLRAWCLSSALTFDAYVETIATAGFGTIEVKARRPFRVLDRSRYGVANNIILDEIDVIARKVPVPADGACVFTGKCAIFTGEGEMFDDKSGHLIPRDVPMPVCDKTARALAELKREDLTITGSTWHACKGSC